jgi:hypothetical protein
MPKVCAVKISDLKRRITMKRKSTGIVGRQTKKSMLRFLDTHQELMHSHGHTLRTEAFLDSQELPYIRKLFKQMVQIFHPPVSKLNAKQVIEYCYATADSLGWAWPSLLRTVEPKKRVSKACLAAKDAGKGKAPEDILPKPRKKKVTVNPDADLDISDASSVRQRPKPRKKRRNRVLDDSSDEEQHEMPDGSMMEGAVHETSPPKRKTRKPDPIAGKRKAEASERLRAKRKDDMFVAAPRKSASVAAKVSQSTGAIKKGARLTEDQKSKLQGYLSSGGRNKKKYSQRMRMYMLRGLSFEEAKSKAESRDSGEVSGPSVPKRPRTRGKPGTGRKFMDDTAGVGR